MNPAHGFFAGVFHYLVFHIFYCSADFLENCKIVVNYRVYKRINKVVASHLSYTALLPDALPHMLKDIPFCFLERDDKIPAKNKADLLCPCFILFIEKKHLQYHKQAVFISLYLWTLLCVHNVFHDKRVQAKLLPYLLYNISIMNTCHIYPCNSRLAAERKAFFDSTWPDFLKLRLCIVNNVNVHFLLPFLSDVDKRSGR